MAEIKDISMRKLELHACGIDRNNRLIQWQGILGTYHVPSDVLKPESMNFLARMGGPHGFELVDPTNNQVVLRLQRPKDKGLLEQTL